jgi:S1-C subfamily serine protease
MGWFEETQQAVAAVAEAVGGSVVGVGQRWAVGSGVVVQEGAVLTNAHNLRGGEVEITLPNGTTATGRPAGVDVDGDLAVIAVDTGDASPIGWDEGRAPLSIGSPVFAVSNPGGRGLRVTLGLVSGTERSFRGPRGRRISGSIEHTSPLLPGSSGSPITDASGNFLGLNTNRLGEGFYLAIPADGELRDRVAALVKGETPARPRLGIGVAPPPVARGLRRAVGLPEVAGLLVQAVEEDSPAARAGLARGDLIAEADGEGMASADALHAALDRAQQTGRLNLKVVRGSEERSVTVALDGEPAGE